MPFSEILYNIILNTVGLAALPILYRKWREDPIFRQGRLGYYDMLQQPDGYPRIWFHAASVGEVTGAVPTLHAVAERMPHASVFLSVATPTGLRFARSHLPSSVRVLPFPLDYPWALARAFETIRPSLFVSFESEFWPNTFFFLRRHKIPALLLNGRLSQRSLKAYRLLRPLFMPVFSHFKWLAMHSEEDRRAVLQLGVPAEKTLVLGSSKYDGIIMKAKPECAMKWSQLLSIPSGAPVIVGGSLRRSECTGLLEAFEHLSRSHSKLVGIFAPRHLEQIPTMVRWLEERHLPFQFLTRIEEGIEARNERIVLVDRIGALFELYSLGDLVFCGGTMEPIGGHNILEPAAWSKAVFYGTHLQKVLHEHTILASLKGSFSVRTLKELLDQWGYWIQHLPELETHGERAREALMILGGVTKKQVDLIRDTLPSL